MPVRRSRLIFGQMLPLCRPMKRWLKLGFLAAMAMVLGTLIGCFAWVDHAASGRLYGTAAEVPPGYDVALVLGCSPKLATGGPNRFFAPRIKAAADLYQKQKCKAIIVSGDNSRVDYDEPSAMRAALVAEGVPDAVIYSDFAGFRTLDSVVRAKEIFGQTKLVIVSQRYHNERAIYLAKAHGIEAVGLSAKAPSMESAPKTYAREIFSRVKAVLDVNVFGTSPKFAGHPVKIAL